MYFFLPGKFSGFGGGSSTGAGGLMGVSPESQGNFYVNLTKFLYFLEISVSPLC